MDKDFDKLHEFVEIMKVSFHCMPSVGHMGSDGRDGRPLLLRPLPPTRQTCRPSVNQRFRGRESKLGAESLERIWALDLVRLCRKLDVNVTEGPA